MATILRCPLCKKVLTQEEYDKALNIWDERRKALTHLQKEVSKQRAVLEKERERLSVAKKELKIKQREAISKAFQKAKEKFEKKREALRIKIEKQYKNIAEKAQRQTQKANENISKLKERMSQQIQAKVACETAKLKISFQHQEKMLKREVSKQVKMQERARIQKLTESIGNRDLKIRELNKQVMELRRQIDQGTTPQIEGLLYEDTLYSELKKTFPDDKIIHTGKGGDILHEAMLGEKKAGLIVYECKRVATFSSKHVSQAREAKQKREADYAVLVTNARKKGKSGFFVESDVIVVHPAGVISLAGLIRESLLTIARASITHEQKTELLRSTLSYLESPEYKNKMKDTIQRTKELYTALHDEVLDHIKLWKKRNDHYRIIHTNVSIVGTKVGALLSGKPLEEIQEIESFPTLYLPEPKQDDPSQDKSS